jgi:hypothetical protein
LEYEDLPLGAHSQGHRYKKGNRDGAHRIMGRRMCTHALEW